MNVSNEQTLGRKTTTGADNFLTPPSTTDHHQSNIEILADGENDEKETSNETPLLLVTAPGSDFSEKLANIPSFQPHQRGLSSKFMCFQYYR